MMSPEIGSKNNNFLFNYLFNNIVDGDIACSDSYIIEIDRLYNII